MSTDIHAYVEFKDRDGQYRALFKGEMFLPASYEIFAALAGIRTLNPPLFPPRGLPAEVTDEVFEGYFIFVIDHSEANLYRGFEYITLDEIGERLESRVFNEHKTGMTSRYGYIAYPDYHTPSWLKLNEIKAALAHSGIAGELIPLAYYVLLEIMESLDRRWGSGASRLVFWFDN